MNTENRLQAAAELLAPWTQETTTPEANRMDLIIQASDLPAASRA